ncbi:MULTISPECIES: hypothetical protein [Xanthobacter]|uniref:hypothetical protein n=1 Tax=Xanthobacter TaxID=279 RepID=UPI0024AD1786|nr:hypothetical protein [Xanthobacter autotrophicus]
MAETKGPTPISTELDLYLESFQVVLTFTFGSEEEADSVFDKMGASIKAKLLEIKAVQPRAPIESDGGAK